jgi:CBS domain-containing protein
MHVQEVMTRDVSLIDPNTTIRDAAQNMRSNDIGALPVGENDRLIGMVTDRDIVMRAVAEDCSPATTLVRDVMSDRIYYCFEDDNVQKAADCMAEHQVRRLPVLNGDKRLVGVVALADLGRDKPEAAKSALEGVSEATGQPRL